MREFCCLRVRFLVKQKFEVGGGGALKSTKICSGAPLELLLMR